MSRRLWIIYAACAALVLAALLWITVTVLQLERAQREAIAEANRQESLRLALWRMDSWLAPRLAQETSRPPSDYLAFRAANQAYTRLYSKIDPGEILTPSPLLAFDSEIIRIHFQVQPDGTMSSPQAPTGNSRDLAEDVYLSSDRLATNEATLTRVRSLVGLEKLAACSYPALDEAIPMASPEEPPVQRTAQADQAFRNIQEWNTRASNYAQTLEDAQLAEPAPAGASIVAAAGCFVPLWVGADGDQELIFVRRVSVEDQWIYQGFLCDWPKLCDLLMGQVTDLFEAATLVPVRAGGSRAIDSMTLATLPARLDVPVAVPLAASMMDPTLLTLAITWIAALAGLVAAAVTIHATMAYARKRARFASAVTHELRTPLTTFRMYTEMLADGMVPEGEQRQSYLRTLVQESGRLSNLVENVLAYARLEEGRRPSNRIRQSVKSMLDRITPTLQRRAESASMTLAIEPNGASEIEIETDVDGVEQILFNLVDNACKYAGAAADRRIHLDVQQVNGAVHFEIADHGPGVGAQTARSVFAPFHRGAEHDGTSPGIGLGLALSRGLARDLGGELELVEGGSGARFRLVMPTHA